MSKKQSYQETADYKESADKLREWLKPIAPKECGVCKGKGSLKGGVICMGCDNRSGIMRGSVPQSATVYCVLRSVSRSGMSRRIDFFTILDGGCNAHYNQYLTRYMARVLGYPMTNGLDKGFLDKSCGMDGGAHTVESLCYALWGMDEKDQPMGMKPGYVIRSEWL